MLRTIVGLILQFFAERNLGFLIGLMHTLSMDYKVAMWELFTPSNIKFFLILSGFIKFRFITQNAWLSKRVATQGKCKLAGWKFFEDVFSYV